jgi:hypothetical protein
MPKIHTILQTIENQQNNFKNILFTYCGKMWKYHNNCGKIPQ